MQIKADVTVLQISKLFLIPISAPTQSACRSETILALPY